MAFDAAGYSAAHAASFNGGGDDGREANGVIEYRAALVATLSATGDLEEVLKQEAIAITRTITDGIRDLVKRDKKVRHFVLDLGVPPLASWAAGAATHLRQSPET